MLDQAHRLRRLVREAQADDSAACDARPRLVVVAGGKGGVGTTTIAVNLALALANAAKRTVLADASPTGSDVAELCGVLEHHGAADVLTGRRRAAEVLQAGPGAIQVLAGVCGQSGLWDGPAGEHDRLVEQLVGLGGRADFVVVDGGNSPTRVARRLWEAASDLLLVATTEPASVLNAYTVVKAIAADVCLPPLWSVVNMAPSREAAEAVHARLALALRRFLGIMCRSAGHIDQTASIRDTIRRDGPSVAAAPRSSAIGQINQLALDLIGEETNRNTEERLKMQAEPTDFMRHYEQPTGLLS
jgi:flagellar biosynthesis protein FlhG